MRTDTGMFVDPHTATGTAAARLLGGPPGPAGPMITLATAHPAKFPDAVENATGVRPALPNRMADLYDRSERVTQVENGLAAVENLIRGRRQT